MAKGDISSSYDAFADAVSAISTSKFDEILLAAINTLVAVDHLTVLTYRSGENLRTLDVSRLAKGAYMIQVIENQNIVSKKMLKL